ncbi:hypothetical protein AGMMS50267_12850 [Spirochaetia bacterium]|nr:hypothetical protein AGMMS50267_12850 [Spirochaetia bacterium]
MGVINGWYKKDEIILKSIFFVVPFVDSLTGLLIKIGLMSEAALFSPSQLFKFVIYLVLLPRTAGVMKRRYYTFYLFVLCMLFSESIIGVIFFSRINYILRGYLNVFKLTYLFLLYIYINELLKKDLLNIKSLVGYIINSGLIFSLLIIITTVLKINRSTYWSGVGTIGLFPGGNGVGLYVGAISLLSIMQFDAQRNSKNAVRAIIISITSVFITTKASIVFLILDFLYFFFFILKKGKIILVFVLLFSFNAVLSKFQDIFSFMIWRYEHSSGMFEFIASARDMFVVDAFKQFNANIVTPIRYITGFGAYISFRDPYNPGVEFDTLENDIFDVFFQYGAIGLIIYLSVSLRIIIDSCRAHIKGLTILALAVIGYSMAAGHTLFNATGGLLFVYILLIGKYAKYNANNRYLY